MKYPVPLGVTHLERDVVMNACDFKDLLPQGGTPNFITSPLKT